MKQFIYTLVIGVFLISTACTGIKSTTKGLENESYLEIVANPNDYSGGVTVLLDNDTSFNAKVGKPNKKRPKDEIYAIPTGKHKISISYDGQIIYSKQIFVSAQETKQITLP